VAGDSTQTHSVARNQLDIKTSTPAMAAHQPTTPGVVQNTITILQWNANGVLHRLAELKNYIASQKYPPDVICIQETHLKQEKKLSIQQYNTERRDRKDGEKGGGVATLVKRHLVYTVLHETADMEELTLKIKFRNQDITIANIYNPPGNKLEESKLHQIVKQTNVILLGDLNAHSPVFGGKQTNAEGVVLDKIIDDNDLAVLNDGSGTYLKRDGTLSCIDVTIASRNLGLKCSWETHTDSLGSDHLPIRIKINEPPEIELNPVDKYSYKKADWTAFKLECNKSFSAEIYDENNENYNRKIVRALHVAASSSIPKVNANNRTRNVPYWNKECKEAVNARKKAEHRMRRTKDLKDCIEFRRTKANAQRVIRQEQQKQWESYCNGLTTDTKLSSVWKMAKNMSGINSNFNIPTLTNNGMSYETSAEKAKLIATTIAATSADSNYSTTFQKHREQIEKQWADEPDIENSNTHDAGDLNIDFEIYELQQAIRQSKNSSAPGNDDITYDLLKHAPKIVLRHLLNLYNSIWRTGEIIPAWKEAIVLPFYKPGNDKTKPTSYRPISLTPAICKINERLIATRLNWYLEKNHLLNDSQSAYRKSRSTIDHLIRLHDDINKSINSKGHTVAIMFDFSKAFDMVWKKGLIHKLEEIGVNGRLKIWISNFLSGRKIRVKVNNSLSEEFDLENGTPQGSVISPLLFLIMINDFPHTAAGTSTSLFADDSAIWRTGKNLDSTIQQVKPDVAKIIEWCDKWGFKLNEKKSVAIVFSKNPLHLNTSVPIDINGHKIETVKQVKFLGLAFDQRLTWKSTSKAL